jgi:tricorn protease
MVHSRPSLTGAREVVFQPLTTETNLFYLNWVESNRARVDRLSNGRIGYLHIPDMGEDGLREFIKRYYPQVRKEGLIVDIRSNGGGSVSWMLLERLRREVLSVDFARTNDTPLVFPYSTFHGHQVTLINESTSSDGDVFAAMFKRSGLGPLIGTRTWGGVVGIGDRGPLIDGGSISVPESASASPEGGEYIIEGYGVDPDIRVENDPKSVIEGRDPQLEKAVEVLLEQMAKEPRKLPARPAPPVKTQAGSGNAGN